MGGLILCNMRSEEPYYISELNINVYSIEEIGYFVFNHTYIVGKEFFNSSLISYIKDQLNLPNIADKIEKSLKQSSPLPDLIYLILIESGYYTEEDLKELLQLLPKLASKSTQERFKAKADLFYENKKFESALNEYYKILEMKREPKLNSLFYAEILNNIATIYTRLFLYDDAEKYFRKAYELSKEEVYLRKLVYVSLLYGGEQKLLGNIVKYDIPDCFVEICRVSFEKSQIEVNESERYKNLCKTLTYEANKDISEYYDELQVIIDTWKEEYRDLMV